MVDERKIMMKLWLVKRKSREEWDVLEGAVVRAASEQEARRMVAATHGDKGYDIWLEPSTRCTVLEAEGNPEVILRDFTNG